MSREVRRVPANWEHPRNEDGHYIPMRESMGYNAAEIKEGLRDGWLKNEPPFYGLAVMPQWADVERTHYQMYESTTEGTPISPVMATAEELARWLVDNGANACAGRSATYGQWLATVRQGWAPSLVFHRGVLESGVEASG